LILRGRKVVAWEEGRRGNAEQTTKAKPWEPRLEVKTGNKSKTVWRACDIRGRVQTTRPKVRGGTGRAERREVQVEWME
jgi:hypothetical protein